MLGRLRRNTCAIASPPLGRSWVWRHATGDKPGREFARMEGRRHDGSGFRASNSELDRNGAHASVGVSGTADTSVDRPAARVLSFVLLGGARLGSIGKSGAIPARSRHCKRQAGPRYH